MTQALIIFGASACFTSSTAPNTEPYQSQGDWIIDAKAAAIRAAQGTQILDTRSAADFEKAHIEKSLRADWRRFSEPDDPNRGRLLGDQALLQSRLRDAGVNNGPILVVGDTITGWGEDGRIAWMLRALGHKDVKLVDGGYAALAKALPTAKGPGEKAPAGDFTIAADSRWSISRDDVRDIVDRKAPVQLVDTREEREFLGATPYGESRGGHVPGAVHLHYSGLLNSHGYLMPRAFLLAELEKLGLDPKKPTVAYCTGGVRSGWFVAILADLGFSDVKNYAGSMWEWSASPEDRYPLTK